MIMMSHLLVYNLRRRFCADLPSDIHNEQDVMQAFVVSQTLLGYIVNSIMKEGGDWNEARIILFARKGAQTLAKGF